MTINPLAGVSADVATILGHERERERVAALPKAKKVQRARDKARRKVTLDFSGSEWLEEKVRDAAESENCGLSSYTLWLIHLGLSRAKEAGLQPRKRPARSLKYAYEALTEGLDE